MARAVLLSSSAKHGVAVVMSGDRCLGAPRRRLCGDEGTTLGPALPGYVSAVTPRLNRGAPENAEPNSASRSPDGLARFGLSGTLIIAVVVALCVGGGLIWWGYSWSKLPQVTLVAI